MRRLRIMTAIAATASVCAISAGPVKAAPAHCEYYNSWSDCTTAESWVVWAGGDVVVSCYLNPFGLYEMCYNI